MRGDADAAACPQPQVRDSTRSAEKTRTSWTKSSAAGRVSWVDTTSPSSFRSGVYPPDLCSTAAPTPTTIPISRTESIFRSSITPTRALTYSAAKSGRWRIVLKYVTVRPPASASTTGIFSAIWRGYPPKPSTKWSAIRSLERSRCPGRTWAAFAAGGHRESFPRSSLRS